MTTFLRLLPKKPFVFFIGPSKLPFHVHADIFAGFSEPLYRMTTAGMKESIHGYATLPEADPEAFALLCEYAYTRAYRLPVERPSLQKSTTFQNENFEHWKPLLGDEWYCRYCGSEESPEYGEFFPFCGSDCQWDAKVADSPSCADQSHNCAGCGEELPDIGPYIYTMSPLCKSCLGTTELPFFPLMKEHAKLVDFRRNSEMSNRVNQYLSGTRSNDFVSLGLLSLAKLFVLADMYRVEDLTKYSLCCLYSDLLSRKPYRKVNSELLCLLEFAHDTDGADSKACREGLSLREIVVMYAEKHRHKLQDSDGFEDYLSSVVSPQT